MINKKMSLFLVYTLSLGQLFTSDNDVNVPETKSKSKKAYNVGEPSLSKNNNENLHVDPNATSSKNNNENLYVDPNNTSIEKLEINIFDKGSIIIDLNASFYSQRYMVNYIKDLETKLSQLVINIDKNIASYTTKANQNFKDNSAEFRKTVSSNTQELKKQQEHVKLLDKEIKTALSFVDNALGIWKKSVGIGIFAADRKSIIESVNKINEFLPVIYKKYQKITNISESIASDLNSFDLKQQNDIQNLRKNTLNNKVEEFKKRVEQSQTEYQIAQKSQNVAQIKEAKTDLVQQESKLQQAQVSAEKQEQLASKIQMQYRNHQTNLLDKDIKNIIQKIDVLRGLIASKVKEVTHLIAKIENQKNHYVHGFVSDIQNNVAPKIKSLVTQMNDIIASANDRSEKIVDLNDRAKSLNKTLISQTDNNAKKQTKSELDKINAHLKLESQLLSNLLKKAENYQELFFNLHAQLLISEQVSRVIDPKSVESVLELIRAVKIELDPKVGRVLELCRAVKLKQ